MLDANIIEMSKSHINTNVKKLIKPIRNYSNPDTESELCLKLNCSKLKSVVLGGLTKAIDNV